MSTRIVVPVLAVAGVVALILILWVGLERENKDAMAIGDPAGNPELIELESGAEASLADYRGRWALINFWSSWCDPCRVESPDLQAFQDAHPSDVAVVGVNVEDVSDKAKDFVEEFGLTYPQLRAADNEDTMEAFSVDGRPENFLIDPAGRIAFIWRGPVTAEILNERVEPIIEAGSPQVG